MDHSFNALEDERARRLVQAMIHTKNHFPQRLLAEIKEIYGYDCSIFCPTMTEPLYRSAGGRWAHTNNLIEFNFPAEERQIARGLLRNNIFDPTRLSAALSKKFVLTISDVMSYEEYEKTETYRFVKSMGYYYYAVLFLKDENLRTIAGICLFRSKEAGDFEEPEVTSLAAPLDDLSALYQMHVQCTEPVMIHSMLNCCTTMLAGVLMTDNRGIIVWANPAAQSIGRHIMESQQQSVAEADRDSAGGDLQPLQRVLLNEKDILLQHAAIKCNLLSVPDYCFYSAPFIVRNIVGNTEIRYLIMIHEQSRSGVNQNEELFALSNRERQVLDCILIGKSNSEIAQVLHISENTVRAHTANIYRKFGVSDKSQLIIKLKE